MPWALAAAALTVGGTLIASNNASDAAHSAADAQSAATAASIAENAREFDTIQANNANARRIGDASLSAVGGAFGLPGYGAAPSMTGPRVASTPVATAGGISMTGRPSGPQTIPAVPDGSVSMVGHNGGPPLDQAAADEYIAEYPDVASWIQSGHGDPSLGADQTPEQAALYHFQHSGQGEGRTWPAVTMTGDPAATGPAGYVAPPGYTDPTAPNGYNPGARPTPAATHPVYTPGMLDVSVGAYQKSPGYDFQMGEGLKALDHTASSMGGIMSGARTKAALKYSQNLANLDYTDWRNYTTGQFNTTNAFGNQLSQEQIAQDNADRARSDGLYQDDRSFLSGQYNNRTGQLMTLAGFGANANAQNANAAQSFASSDAQLRMTGANAQGNASIAGANAFTSGVNNLMTTGAYLGGQYMSGRGLYGVTPPTYSAPLFTGAPDETAGLY